jgi:hypothetical protein
MQYFIQELASGGFAKEEKLREGKPFEFGSQSK